jgi:hypothetical protein
MQRSVDVLIGNLPGEGMPLPIAAKVIHRAGPPGSNTTFGASFNAKTGLATAGGLFTSDAGLSLGRVEAPQLLPVVAMVFGELAARRASRVRTCANKVVACVRLSTDRVRDRLSVRRRERFCHHREEPGTMRFHRRRTARHRSRQRAQNPAQVPRVARLMGLKSLTSGRRSVKNAVHDRML